MQVDKVQERRRAQAAQRAAEGGVADGGEPVVRVRDVGMSFRSAQGQVTALEGIDLDVARGEVVAIVGPSGCGKSTLLRLIAGLRAPTSGEVSIRQTTDRPATAMVFQDHALFPWLTVEKNVGFGLRSLGVSKDEALTQARDQLCRLGLEEFCSYYPHQLSGGMKQRVGIARALAYGAEVLLMDEPLGALDAQTRIALQEEFRAVINSYGATCVYVTHAIDEAVFLSDRVVLMSSRPGRVRAEISVPFRTMEGAAARSDPRFAEHTNQIWEHLRDDVQSAIAGGLGRTGDSPEADDDV